MSRHEDDWGDDDQDFDQIEFASPGTNSALRAATSQDPRIHPCPACETPNRLTRQDVSLGYQCDRCADRAELGWDY